MTALALAPETTALPNCVTQSARPGRNRPPLPRQTERLESIGPMEPGHCNQCGGPLPEGSRWDLLFCSEACKKDWNSTATSRGRQLYTALIYAEHARQKAAKTRSLGRRFPSFHGVSAFARALKLSRAAYADLRKYWSSYND